MDLMDTKEEAAFRDEIQTWMHETLDEYPEFKLDRDFSGTIDDQDWELRIEWEKFLGKAKWLGMSWPKEYGGRGADINKVLIFHEEYAKFGVPARANFFGEGLFAPTLLLNGTHEQKLHYLPRIQSGQDIWCQGYSEPNAGSDLVSARTNGKLNEAGEYIVNGQKIWATLAHMANNCFVVARTEPGAKPHESLSFLLVPMIDNGVEVRGIKQITGASEFNEIFFTNSKAEAVLGEVGQGWKVAMTTLGFERATAFLDQQAMFANNFWRLVEIAREREVLNDPSIRQEFAKSYIGLINMKMTARRLLPDLVKPGEPIGPRSSVGKLIWTTWYKEFGELVTSVRGTSGLVVETTDSGTGGLAGVSKVPFDSLGPSIFAGTTQIQKDIVGGILGLPRG